MHLEDVHLWQIQGHHEKDWEIAMNGFRKSTSNGDILVEVMPVNLQVPEKQLVVLKAQVDIEQEQSDHVGNVGFGILCNFHVVSCVVLE